MDFDFSIDELVEKLTMAGLEIASVESVSGDTVIEVEITSNRPDWLSIVGVARETAAISGKNIKAPYQVLHNLNDLENLTKHTIDFKVDVDNTTGCPFYSAHFVKNVKVVQSPEWLRKKMELVGVRSVNNIVDITNLILFETGQPMHAFDMDKLSGGRLCVRSAKNGEKIKLIDGSEKELSNTDLVIADDVKPVALAGIMGGKDTEVDLSTKNIVLESAVFDPIMVRRTARRLGISSDSSYRFERNVDKNFVVPAALRVLQIVDSMKCGDVAAKNIYIGNAKSKVSKVILRLTRVEKIIGAKIPSSKIVLMLKNLGFKISKKDLNKLYIEVPSFRRDVIGEVDLIEEIVRIWGYEKILLNIPKSVDYPQDVYPKSYVVKKKIADSLSNIGFFEIISYSLVNGDLLEKTSCKGCDCVKVVNPLSKEQEFMRTSLLPGLLSQISRNLNRGNDDIKFFEIGKIYRCEKSVLMEREVLSIGLCANRFSDWQDGKKQLDFFDLKGYVEFIAGHLGIGDISFEEINDSRFSYCASVKHGKEILGIIGNVSDAILRSCDIKRQVFAGELYMDLISNAVDFKRKFVPIDKFPSVVRDIALLVSDDIKSNQIVDIIWRQSKGLIVDVKLFDLYKGDKIQKGFKSLAYSLTFNAKDRSLTDEQVNEIASDIRDVLVKQLGVVVR